MSDRKYYKDYILFSKGWYKIPEKNYWDALLFLATKYNGLELRHERLEYVYDHTTAAIKHFIPYLTFDKWNEIYFEICRFGENLFTREQRLTQIQLMIRTNLSILSMLTNDQLGGNVDWLEKENLIDMPFEKEEDNG